MDVAQKLIAKAFSACRCARSVLRWSLFFCLNGVLWATSTAAQNMPNSQVLSILVPASIIEDFTIFVDGRDILSIDDYGGDKSRREVAEMVLMHQALYLGGYRGAIKYVEQEVDYLRSLHMIADGKAAIFGATAWYENVSAENSPYWVTEPLVRNGEFVVGLYTSAKNTKAMSVNSLADLRHLRAVSNVHWGTDWRNLELLNLTHVYSVRQWSNMARMVQAQRADFTLAPFRSGTDRSLSTEDFTLTPIPNVSFALEGSRHWVTSKTHPMGKKAYQSLSRGLASLRNQGSVVRAYTESGFFQPKHDHWPEINRANRTRALSTPPERLAIVATDAQTN